MRKTHLSHTAVDVSKAQLADSLEQKAVLINRMLNSPSAKRSAGLLLRNAKKCVTDKSSSEGAPWDHSFNQWVAASIDCSRRQADRLIALTTTLEQESSNVIRPDFGHAEQGEAGHQQIATVELLKLLLGLSHLIEMYSSDITFPQFPALPQAAMPYCFAKGAHQREIELDDHYVVKLSLDAALQLTSDGEEPATVVKCLVNEVLAPLFRQAGHHQPPSYFWTLESNLDLRNGSVRAKPGLEGRAIEINLLLQVPGDLEQKVKETLDRQSGSVRIAYGHDGIGDRGFGVAGKASSDMVELQALQHVLKWSSLTGASEDVRSAAEAFYELHVGKITGAPPRLADDPAKAIDDLVARLERPKNRKRAV